MPEKKQSFRYLRILFSYIILAILINGIYYVGIKSWMNHRATEKLESFSHIIINEFVNDPEKIGECQYLSGIEYYLYERDSKEFIASNTDSEPEYVHHDISSSKKFLEYGAPKWFYYETSFADESPFLLVLRENAAQARNDLMPIFAAGFGISALFILYFGRRSYLIIKKQFAPIEKITDKIKGIKPDKLDFRLDHHEFQGELKDFILAFNNVLHDIEESIRRKEHLLCALPQKMNIPASSILSFTKMFAQEGEENLKKRKAILAIRKEASAIQKYTENFINCIMDYKEPLVDEIEEFRLNDLIEEIVSEAKLYDEDHSFSVSCEPHIYISADRDRLKDALRLFLDNSIKISPKKEEISVGIVDTDKEIVISIHNTAPTKKKLANLFDRFDEINYRHSNTVIEDVYLGFLMAGMIIKQHDGDVMLDTKSRKNIVTIMLPKIIRE